MNQSSLTDNLTGGPEAADVIVRGGAGGFAQEIIAGPHRFSADEPGPYDLLLAALGSRRGKPSPS